MGLKDGIHGKIYKRKEMGKLGSIGDGGYGKTDADADSDSYFIRFAAEWTLRMRGKASPRVQV